MFTLVVSQNFSSNPSRYSIPKNILAFSENRLRYVFIFLIARPTQFFSSVTFQTWRKIIGFISPHQLKIICKERFYILVLYFLTFCLLFCRRLSAIDNERVSTIVSSVLEKEPSFQCLQCPQSFPSYSDLCQHKSDAHPLTKVNSLKPSKCNNEEPLNKNRELKEVDADLKTCLTNALDSVPEVTFNNMHGTIKDIGSLDAQEFQSKTLGTVEKVKMNVSEKWTRKDVWESGWESSNHVLNWHKYQSTEFLQQMASVSWSEQRLFQVPKGFENSLEFWLISFIFRMHSTRKRKARP